MLSLYLDKLSNVGNLIHLVEDLRYSVATVSIAAEGNDWTLPVSKSNLGQLLTFLYLLPYRQQPLILGGSKDAAAAACAVVNEMITEMGLYYP